MRIGKALSLITKMPPNPYMSLRINFHGLFQSPMSWAHVNREMALALDQLGCQVTVKAHRGFGYDPQFPLDPRIEALRKGDDHQDIDVAFDYPLHYSRLSGRFKVGLLVYETSELPPAWVEAIQGHLDLLVVPSRFCRKLAIQSGVSPERIEVIPYGFNPRLYHRSVAPQLGFPRSGFVFLCVAMPHIRKGIPELVQAFIEEFDPGEPVGLVVKTTYLPREQAGKSRDWEIPGLARRIQSLGCEDRRGRRIHLMSRAMAPDEMPGLYASSHAYVQPSYSEGFGLSILEAKAVGRPTVVTGWGGHMDFCTDTNSYLVEYDMVPAGKAQYDHASLTACAARPGSASLRQQMRLVYTDTKEAERRVFQSFMDIHQFTWDMAARRLADLLRERI